MKEIATRIIVLIVIAFVTAGSATRVFAGSGIITNKSDGNVVNLTVYFDDKKQDQEKWIANFKETHKMLWTATRGMLRLGEIRLGTDPSVKGRADIRIDKEGHASVSQPDDRERTSLGTGDVLYLFEEDLKHPIITVHELGHYLFCLSDEYKSDIWAKINGVVQVVEKGDEALSYCSVERASPRTDTKNPNHSCVMYDNDTPNIYYLFCAEEHLTRNDLPDGRWAVTRQQRDNKKSCLATIAASLGIQTLPAVQTKDAPDTPTIITLKPERRVGVLIQADLSGPSLQKAKNVAVETLKRLRLPVVNQYGGDSVGISTFGASVTVIHDWKALETREDVDAAVSRINAIQPVTGKADLESSLRAEMTSIASDGYPFATRTILLFANTPGKVNQTLIDELRRKDVVVDVVSDNSSLKDLAVKTGGDFTLLSALGDAPQGLLAARLLLDDDDEEESDAAVAAGMTGGYTIARFRGTLEPGRPIIQSLPVDELNDEITIDFRSADGGPLTLGLKDPAGNLINLDNPPANVQVQRTDARIEVRIEEPAPGAWTAEVDGAAAVYTLELVGTGDAMGEPDLPVQSTTFPAARRVYLMVENGMIVIGCQVEAVVTRPDGTKVTVTLYDDGDLAFHGDMQANDGVYSAFFTQYAGSGAYRVEFRINNTNGRYSTAFDGADTRPGDPPPGPVGPAPVFRRILNDSFVVDGVPAAGGAALLAPGNLTLRSAAAGQVTLSWTDTNQGRARTVILRDSGGANGYQEIATLNADQTQYTDTAAGTNGQVSYRLRARTAAGDSQSGSPEAIDVEKVASLFAADGSGTASSSSRSGCFIATAAYGSAMAPHVQTLRDFRDRTLMRFALGRWFIGFYSRTSPPLADYLVAHPWARLPIRMVLTPIVYCIEYPVIFILSVALAALLAFGLVRRRRPSRACTG